MRGESGRLEERGGRVVRGGGVRGERGRLEERGGRVVRGGA